MRYDELVTDFERVTNGVFDFLGVPWDESVRDFSKAAEQRAATTPSYQKVRQGLSIGVQTAVAQLRLRVPVRSGKTPAQMGRVLRLPDQMN